MSMQSLPCRSLALAAVVAALTATAQVDFPPDAQQGPPPPRPPEGQFEPRRPGQPFGPGPGWPDQRGPGGRGGRFGDGGAGLNRPPMVESRVVVLNLGALTEPQTQDMDADLNVMRVILERTLDEFNGQRPLSAMGIPLTLNQRFGRHEAVFLDGYGVLFRLFVTFPLSPDAGAKAGPEARAKGTVWEQARRELLQQNGGSGGDATEEILYDEARVARLKEVLTGALKHAANIRHLKPDDRVTISVTSVLGRRIPGALEQPPRPPRPPGNEPPGAPGNGESQRPPPPNERNLPMEPLGIDTLVLSTTKAELGRLAGGALNQEEFLRKLQVKGTWEGRVEK
jgi:hypothetical protein